MSHASDTPHHFELISTRHDVSEFQDWGNVLLSEALAKVSQAGRLIGLVGVQLETSPQGRRLYEALGFSTHPIFREPWLYLPLNAIPKLE